jgi:4-hydroxythreonine-4-phosphate dehydrogenase
VRRGPRTRRRNAAAVIAAIERATEAVVRARAALVTSPIAKHVLAQSGFAYPGHTEFLAALAERHTRGKKFRPVMMLAARELRVVPLTVHCALASVPGAITRTLIFETVRITYEALKRDFGVAAPRIAVTGLNPHAGEEGDMGREEIDTIAPAIADLRAEGLSRRVRTLPTRCSTRPRAAATMRRSPCITTRR